MIILSTMFLKQHSVLDVIGGVVLGAIMYGLVYCINWDKVFVNNSEAVNKLEECEEVRL